MFFFFLFGEQTFTSELKEFQGKVFQCHHCGNVSAHVLKHRPCFTICFVPLVPFTISGYKDVTCSICHFQQPLEGRPDVQTQAHGAPDGQQQQQQPPGDPPQGGPYNAQSPPPQGYNAGQNYNQQGSQQGGQQGWQYQGPPQGGNEWQGSKPT